MNSMEFDPNFAYIHYEPYTLVYHSNTGIASMNPTSASIYTIMYCLDIGFDFPTK
jgi:hypothetical protein